MIMPLPKCAYKSFVLGLGWNSKVDIDSSIIMFDQNNNEFDTVFYGNSKSKDGSVNHRGDSREGGNGDKDEE